MKRDRLFMVGAMLLAVFAITALIIFFTSSADAAATHRSPIDLPPISFTPTDITPTDIPVSFKDVKAGEWYYNAVVWAYQNEVANGTSKTTSESDAPVTREQLVTLLWRYVGQPDSAKDLSSFPDADKISAYAVTAARWAVENGIVNGKEGGRFDPEGNATRAEIAVIFMRAGEALES